MQLSAIILCAVLAATSVFAAPIPSNPNPRPLPPTPGPPKPPRPLPPTPKPPRSLPPTPKPKHRRELEEQMLEARYPIDYNANIAVGHGGAGKHKSAAKRAVEEMLGARESDEELEARDFMEVDELD